VRNRIAGYVTRHSGSLEENEPAPASV
jgi:ribosomal protein S17E